MLSVNGFRAALRYLTMFKEGMICTVSLSFLTVVFGFLLALVLALMRMSRVKPLSIFASIYVEAVSYTHLALLHAVILMCTEVLADEGRQRHREAGDGKEGKALELGIGAAARHGAVSYTHLDVYKRQGGRWAPYTSCRMTRSRAS